MASARKQKAAPNRSQPAGEPKPTGPGASTRAAQKSPSQTLTALDQAEINEGRRRIPYKENEEDPKPDPDAAKRTLSGPVKEKLQSQIEALFKELIPSPDDEKRRATMRLKVEEKILQPKWPEAKIEVLVYGSSGNMLCAKDSDVDMCICTGNGTIRLDELADLLREKGMQRVRIVPAAKVPIVKAWDPELELSGDFNINNPSAVENTRMVRTYVMLDPRVRMLMMIVKHWIRRRILNVAGPGGTLSPYTWICMALHYLQQREPPVIPSLNELPHEEVLQDGVDVGYANDLSSIDFKSKNTESIAELLSGFFRYYGYEFDYAKRVVSIRTSEPQTRESMNWKTTCMLCVQEPFNTDRNLGNSADDYSVRGIQKELREAFNALSESDFEEFMKEYKWPTENPAHYDFKRPTTKTVMIVHPQQPEDRRQGKLYNGRRPTNDRVGHQFYNPGQRGTAGPALYSHPLMPVGVNHQAHLNPTSRSSTGVIPILGVQDHTPTTQSYMEDSQAAAGSPPKENSLSRSPTLVNTFSAALGGPHGTGYIPGLTIPPELYQPTGMVSPSWNLLSTTNDNLFRLMYGQGDARAGTSTHEHATNSPAKDSHDGSMIIANGSRMMVPRESIPDFFPPSYPFYGFPGSIPFLGEDPDYFSRRSEGDGHGVMTPGHSGPIPVPSSPKNGRGEDGHAAMMQPSTFDGGAGPFRSQESLQPHADRLTSSFDPSAFPRSGGGWGGVRSGKKKHVDVHQKGG